MLAPNLPNFPAVDINQDQAEHQKWLAKTHKGWKELNDHCRTLLEVALPLHQRLSQGGEVTHEDMAALERQAREINSVIGGVAPVEQLKLTHLIGDEKELPTEAHARVLAQVHAVVNITTFLQQLSAIESSGVVDAKLVHDVTIGEHTLIPVGKRLVELSKAMSKQTR
jgi:hypothetical protein